MARIRFHLGAGENYKKWQIREGKNLEFYNPSEVHIVMRNCKLVNHEKIAKKINDGQRKQVCAWIEVIEYEVIPKKDFQIDEEKELKFNPRICPNWQNKKGENQDGQKFSFLITIGNRVFMS